MKLIDRLRAACGGDHVLVDHHQLRTYESDGLLQYAQTPAVAVLPGTAEEVAAVVRAVREGTPVPCTGDDGWGAAAMCLKAAESLRTGSPVTLSKG